MSDAEAKKLSAQRWEREPDRAQYSGYALSLMLKHWKVIPEDLLKCSVGTLLPDPCYPKHANLPYRRLN